MDLGARLETIFWDGNLVLFFLALMTLIILILMNVSGFWLVVPSIIMLTTFIVGAGFTKHIPNVHLSEFADALRHQEILLMVDVPVSFLFCGILRRQWRRCYDSENFHVYQMDADVCIHCTFPDIGIFPGGAFVERQR